MNANVHIRPLQDGDGPHIFAAVHESLAEVSPWLAELNAGLNLAAVQSYIESQPSLRADRKAYNFAIVDTLSDSILGGCGLTHINWQNRFANLYYWVRSTRVGQGIASTATLRLAHFGFEALELHRIEIVVAKDNSASIRVAEKVRATREGFLRNRISVHGALHDAYMYSLIPSDVNLDPAGTGLTLG